MMEEKEAITVELAFRLQSIEIAEAATETAESAIVTRQQIQASVLSKFARFLADNADLMPPKEMVLGALDKAIDLAFAAMGRPVIANLIKPIVKLQILNAAGAMYDSIFTPTPRTEV